DDLVQPQVLGPPADLGGVGPDRGTGADAAGPGHPDLAQRLDAGRGPGRPAVLGLAGHLPVPGLRPDLGGGLAVRQAVAEVAGLRRVPAAVPHHAVLLLRELLPAPAGQLLTVRPGAGGAAGSPPPGTPRPGPGRRPRPPRCGHRCR